MIDLETRLSALEFKLSELAGERAERLADEMAADSDMEAYQMHLVIKLLIAQLMVSVPDFDLEALRKDLKTFLLDPFDPPEDCSEGKAALLWNWRRRNEALISECLPEAD